MSDNEANHVTPEWVEARVAEIEAASGDDETAHCLEDNLYSEVLHAIAEGRCSDPAKCATEAIKTEKINFQRLYS